MSEYLNHGDGEKNKKFRAAVKTLAVNKAAQIDIALGGAAGTAAGLLINAKSGKEVIAGLVGLVGTTTRSYYVENANKRDYEAGLEGDYFPDQRDERTVWGYVADAVKTGEPQLPQVTERKFDGIDRARHFNRRRQ